MIKSAFTTKVEQKILKEENETVYYKSQFKFLSSHNGIRPGKIHVLLGVASGGKSTVTRSVQIDALEHYEFNRGKCLCWLSEESTDDFKTQLAYTGYHSDRLKELFLFSELETPQKSEVRYLIELILSGKFELIFLDNITTSKLYAGLEPTKQQQVILDIKAACAKTDTAIFIVAHTSTEITANINRLITMNDVRGSRAIVNLAEFWYTLQNFQCGRSIFPTIKQEKSRGQDTDCKLYFLQYIPRAKIYAQDKQLDFEDFKHAYTNRNKL